MIMPASISYLALYFTDCTTLTSRNGVKKEIYLYVPLMAMIAGSGILLLIILEMMLFMEVI
jgi:hypothetical protein